ncbi:MAG TPA: tape measure protein [Armatimonadota bacterium]
MSIQLADIVLKLGADVRELETAVNKATKDAEATVRASAKRMTDVEKERVTEKERLGNKELQDLKARVAEEKEARIKATYESVEAERKAVAARVAQIKAASKEMRGLDKATVDAGQRLSRLSTTLEGLRGVGWGLTAAFGGMVLGMAAVAKSGTDMNVTLTQTQAALTLITGSSGGAAKLIKDLRREALSSRLEFKEMLPIAQSLAAAYGPNGLGKVIPTMRAFGDTATALGISRDAQERALLGFRQILSRGSASQQDLNQVLLNMPGLNVAGVLKRRFGTADTEALQRAHVTGQQVADALVAGMQQQFGGAQQKLAGTLPMILSNFGDAFNEFTSRLTSKFTPDITKALGTILKSFTALTQDAQAMTALRAPFDALGDTMLRLSETARKAIEWFRGLSSGAQDLLVSLGTGLGSTAGLVGGALLLASSFVTVADRLMRVKTILAEIPQAAAAARFGLYSLATLGIYKLLTEGKDAYDKWKAAEKERDTAGGNRAGVLREAIWGVRDAREKGWPSRAMPAYMPGMSGAALEETRSTLRKQALTDSGVGQPAMVEIERAAKALGIADPYGLPKGSPLLQKLQSELQRRMEAASKDLSQRGGYAKVGSVYVATELSSMLKQLPANVRKLLESHTTRGVHPFDELSKYTHKTGHSLDVDTKGWSEAQRSTVQQALEAAGLGYAFRTKSSKWNEHLHLAAPGGSSNWEQLAHANKNREAWAAKAAADVEEARKADKLYRDSVIAGISDDTRREIAVRREATRVKVDEIRASALSTAKQHQAISSLEAELGRDIQKIQREAAQKERDALKKTARESEAARKRYMEALKANLAARETDFQRDFEDRLADLELYFRKKGVPEDVARRWTAESRLKSLQGLGDEMGPPSPARFEWRRRELRQAEMAVPVRPALVGDNLPIPEWAQGNVDSERIAAKMADAYVERIMERHRTPEGSSYGNVGPGASGLSFDSEKVAAIESDRVARANKEAAKRNRTPEQRANQEFWARTSQDMQAIFAQGFLNIGKGAKGMFSTLLGGFKDMILQIIAEVAAKKVVGFLGGLFGIPLMAEGGTLARGQAAIVGERGPELFLPRNSGTIIPNEQLTGTSVTINMGTVHVHGREGARQVGAELADAFRRSLRTAPTAA